MNGKKKRTEKMRRRKNRIGYVLFGAFLGMLMCAVVGGVGVWLLKEQKMPAEDREEELLEASAGQKPAEGVQPEAAEPDGLETPEQEEPEKTGSEDTRQTDADEEETAVQQPEEPEKTEEELLEERIQEVMNDMTIEEKVLQLFMITPEALTGGETVTAAGDRTREAIAQYPVGGIVYFTKNLKEPEQVRTMLQNTRQYYEEAGYPVPFFGVDEEGGQVARIGRQPAFGMEQIEDMRSIGDRGEIQEAKRVGQVIGACLSDLGFTLDFAPVADVVTNPENQVIGRRSFGTDPELVADFAMAEVRGLEDYGVWAVLKHYPGHGATLGDSHQGYAYTDKSLEELTEAELVPFQRGIQEGIHFIMAAHIAVPSVTGDETPCTLSSYMISEVLRSRMGYDGIVITDAMNMGAISQQYDSAEAAVLALQAGVDLILMPVDFHNACEGVLAALETGELTGERIDESVRRILRVKESVSR